MPGRPSAGRPGGAWGLGAFGASPAVLTRTLLTCYAGTAIAHLASVTLNTLLPFHVTALGGTKTQVGLLFSVMTVVSMLVRPAAGGWVDHHGFRRVMLPGVIAMAGASLALQAAGTPGAVIVVVVGVGLGHALGSTATGVLVARASADEHRGEALSLYFLANSISVALAPPLAFGLMRWHGVRLGFAAVTALALLNVVLTLTLPRTPPASRPPGRPRVRLLSRHAIPLGAALVLTTIGHSSIYAFVPLYAVSHRQGPALAAFFTTYFLCLIAGRVLFRGLSDRVGRAQVIVPSMGLTACGFLVLALPPTPGSLVAAAALLGSGGAVLYPTLAALVVERAPEAERGLALGTLSAAWDLGVVVGSTLVGTVAEHVSYGAGFVVGGAGGALGLAAFAALERGRARARRPR